MSMLKLNIILLIISLLICLLGCGPDVPSLGDIKQTMAEVVAEELAKNENSTNRY